VPLSTVRIGRPLVVTVRRVWSVTFRSILLTYGDLQAALCLRPQHGTGQKVMTVSPQASTYQRGAGPGLILVAVCCPAGPGPTGYENERSTTPPRRCSDPVTRLQQAVDAVRSSWSSTTARLLESGAETTADFAGLPSAGLLREQVPATTHLAAADGLARSTQRRRVHRLVQAARCWKWRRSIRSREHVLHARQERSDQAKFVRDRGDCLSCHASANTARARACWCDPCIRRQWRLPHFGAGTFRTNHSSRSRNAGAAGT